MQHRYQRAWSVLSSALVVASLIAQLSLQPALAQTTPAASPAPAPNPLVSTITGTVVSQSGGLAVGHAIVTLQQGATTVSTTQTDGYGQYTFTGVVPGVYSVLITAEGMRPTRIVTVEAIAGGTQTIRTVLVPAVSETTGNLREIASVSTVANGQTLASSSTIQYSLSPQQLQSTGNLNFVGRLASLPGVNLSGSPHTVGDDSSISIRGLSPSEVMPLIDGHPVGPIGVFSPDTYDYANSPYQMFSNIVVTSGSGATGIYGVDVIGGTVDMQTLSPTRDPHGSFLQAIGDQNTLVTVATATGSVGRLGYALGDAVSGTTGDFAPGIVTQGARPNNNLNLPNGGACTAGNDITSCNTALNSYSVSGNYLLRSVLGKLRYTFGDEKTSLSFTTYSGNQLSDSTGNGDNDNIPYDTRLAEIKAQPQTCPGGYTVITNANPAACLTAQQWAQASYGPYGGGADRHRGTSLQDYTATFNTAIGLNNLSAVYYSDYYDFWKNSNQAAGFDPTRTYYVGTGTYQDSYLTSGLFLSDDLAFKTNDVGFGYFVLHQRSYGNQFTPGPPAAFTPDPEFGTGEYSYFIRDIWTPSAQFTGYLNAWVEYSNVTNQTTFDPRLSLQYRPTPNDVIRLTGGRADGNPSAGIKGNAITGIDNPSSLNVSCTLLNSVASGGNPNLKPEEATDVEAAYGHRFWADTAFNLVGYVSSVQNELFNAIEPITEFGPVALNNPTLQASLPGFATKINSVCGTSLDATTVLPYLGVTTTYNAASGLYRGFELTGRIRATRQLYLDFLYDIQSSQLFGIDRTILTNNPFVLDGGQIYEVPVHTGSLTLDFNSLHGFEAQWQSYYVGDNNTWNRPAFNYSNAFISQKLPYGLRATLSATNILNQNAQVYGYFGHQLFAPQNQYQPNSANSIQQAVNFGNITELEELGLSPRVVMFQLGYSF